MVEEITFWHVGLERVCNGTLTGRNPSYHGNTDLVEVRYKDAKGIYTTSVRQSNILDRKVAA
jgi:hypothetical protein